MNILLIFASIFFALWIARNTFFWVYLWQLKEYRLDRLLAHLRETTQGRRLLFSPLSTLKWITLIAFSLVVFDKNLLVPYQVFVTAFLGAQTLLIIREIVTGRFRMPVPTGKAILIFLLTFTCVIFLSSFPLLDVFFWYILFDRVNLLFVAFFVFGLSMPTEFYRDFQIEKAIRLIEKRRVLKKKFLVIGVTGSYGKSSTKEFIAQILSKKFKVLKTKGTDNTTIGVANTITSGLKDNTEIFVAELGAYKIGEIAQICQIIKPDIGVLTGVNEQHLSLFGSLENTKKAKYELIESLPKDGLALFNGNNNHTRQLYQNSSKTKVLYEVNSMTTKDKTLATNGRLISGVVRKISKNSVSFIVITKGEKIELNAPLLGAHNIENILPAIYIAEYLGMSASEIKEAVSSLSNLPKTMQLVTSNLPSVIVDDTFSANPDSIISVLNYMETYKGKKILVLYPMIELGGNGAKEHFELGKQIGRVCDYLFLTNRNFYREITAGIEESRGLPAGRQGKCVVSISSPQAVALFIRQKTMRKDVVIFEGREAASPLKKVLQ